MSDRTWLGEGRKEWADYNLGDFHSVEDLCRAAAWKLPAKAYAPSREVMDQFLLTMEEVEGMTFDDFWDLGIGDGISGKWVEYDNTPTRGGGASSLSKTGKVKVPRRAGFLRQVLAKATLGLSFLPFFRGAALPWAANSPKDLIREDHYDESEVDVVCFAARTVTGENYRGARTDIGEQLAVLAKARNSRWYNSCFGGAREEFEQFVTSRTRD